MSEGIQVFLAVIAVIGPIASAFGASALTNHRLARLEKKVDEHNGFDRRITATEESSKQAHLRINEIREMVMKWIPSNRSAQA